MEITKGFGGGSGGGGGGSKVAVAEATSGLGDQGVDPDGDNVASSSVAAASPGAPHASSSSLSQPLEEVNPSILNAKEFSSGSSGGGVDAGGDGKEGRSSSSASATPGGHHEPPPPSSQTDGEGGRPAIGGPHLIGESTTGAVAVPLPAALSGDGTDGTAVAGDAGSPNHGGVLPMPPPARGPSATAEVARAVADRRDRSSSGGAVRGRGCSAAAGGGEYGGDMDGSPERGVKPPAAAADDRGSGGGAGLGSRLNGKSVLAKGSTGVSPMQKRNRRELKVGRRLVCC